ncbi:MAG: heparinase II/III family protein [Bacteroidia bacterium]|nr:heparinase II/III family protein [Bacteroidia bacterium]
MKNFLQQIFRLYETVKHLRGRQIFFRFIKPFRKRWSIYQATKIKLRIPDQSETLILQSILPSPVSLRGNKFSFLNLEKEFADGNINWKFQDNGLLWNYHLNYFDFLNQENLPVEDGITLIHHFIDNTDFRSHSYDPYPASLRGINWIKFLIKNTIEEAKIDESLFRQYVKLSKETEYHLGANHILENGFSLLFAAFYFHDEKFFQLAENILMKELQEQILPDGAHFELSTMYHRIILHHTLDCVNMMMNKRTENDMLQNLLSDKASAMLSWMNQMTFSNNEMPDLNDSANNIALSPDELNTYAQKLSIFTDKIPLSVSGYRKISFPKYEIIVDAGNVMPPYNPGHSHSDMLSFCININNKPVIVDCGTSTYDNNQRRRFERSTSAHNTVLINGLEQSDMWSSFRVGRRARVIEISSTENSFSSVVNGFTATGILHKRMWLFQQEKIIITDLIHGKREIASKAFLHFHPEVEIKCTETKIMSDSFEIIFKNHHTLSINEYDFAEGFNRLRKAQVAVIVFSNNLETEFIV